MATVRTISITSGIPSSGTGEVSTIDNFATAVGSPSTTAATIQVSTTPNSSNNPIVVGLVSTSPGVVPFGQTTMANSLPVTMASNQTAITVTSTGVTYGYTASNSFTTSTEPIPINSLVASSTGTAPLTFTTLGRAGEMMLTSVSMTIGSTILASNEGQYVLYLYSATPPSSPSYSSGYNLSSGDRTVFLGPVNLGTPTDLGDSTFTAQDAINKQITFSSANLFCLLTSVSSFTPAGARSYSISLHAVPV